MIVSLDKEKVKSQKVSAMKNSVVIKLSLLSLSLIGVMAISQFHFKCRFHKLEILSLLGFYHVAVNEFIKTTAKSLGKSTPQSMKVLQGHIQKLNSECKCSN